MGNRVGYGGTWNKTSKLISPRTPFRTDPSHQQALSSFFSKMYEMGLGGEDVGEMKEEEEEEEEGEDENDYEDGWMIRDGTFHEDDKEVRLI